jgi:hypothetical protein
MNQLVPISSPALPPLGCYRWRTRRPARPRILRGQHSQPAHARCAGTAFAAASVFACQRAPRLVDIRRGEGADARLLAASLRRAHDIAGDPDDAVLLAEQIQRLNSLFGEADRFASAETFTPSRQSSKRT